MVFKKIPLLSLVLTMGVLGSDIAWTMEEDTPKSEKPFAKASSEAETQALIR